MDLSKAADQGIAALAARLEAEPPPGVSPEFVSGFFGRHGATLSNELRRLIQAALAVPLRAELRALRVAGRVATVPGPAVNYANAADLALAILDERRGELQKWRESAAEAFRRWAQAERTPLPTPLAAALVEFVTLKDGDEKTIADVTTGFGLVPSSGPNEVYDYRVTFTGIFGRNRTVKDESVKLLRHVPRSEPKTIEELMPLIRDVLEEQRVRNDATVVVREYPLEITADGFEKHVIGSVRVLFRGSAKDIL